MIILSTLAGGIVLILYGQRFFEFSLQKTLQIRLQLLHLWFLRYKWFAFLSGGFLALSNKSLSIIIKTLGSLISSKIIGVKHAINLLIGTGFGSALLIQIIAFNIDNYSLLIIAVGFLLSRIKPEHGGPLLGFGFICYGVYIIGIGIGLIKETYFGKIILEGISTNYGIATMFGAIFYFLTRSILVPIGAAVGLVNNGLHVQNGFLLILGGYIGSGMLFSLTCVKMNYNAVIKRLSTAYLCYRFFGWVLGLFFAVPLMLIAKEVTIFFSEDVPSLCRQLANAYTIFIMCIMSTALPFMGIFERFAKKIIYRKGYIKKEYITAYKAVEAKEQITSDVYKLALEIKNIIGNMVFLWADDSRKKIIKVKEQYELIIREKDSIERSFAGISKKMQSEEESLWYVHLTGIVGNLEKIAVVAGKESIEFVLRNGQEKELIPKNRIAVVSDIHALIAEEYNSLLDLLNKGDKGNLNKVLDADYGITMKLQDDHDSYCADQSGKNLSELSSQGALYLDAVDMLKRLHRHIQRIANLISRLPAGKEFKL
jgi:Na+/phosphate symporter